MRDRAMSQDFRIAMTILCLGRLEPDDGESGVVRLGPRMAARRIAAGRRPAPDLDHRQDHAGTTDGRCCARSAGGCGSAGATGICLTLDIRQILRSRAPAGEGVRYSPAAVIDAFEVLRQLIDDSEAFQGLMVVVLADEALTGLDPKRSLNAYDALKMRVWDDVRATERDNPLAPLVRLQSERRLPTEAA